MVYKPHIHCALTAGGITLNSKWVSIGSIAYTRLAKVIQDNLVKEILRKDIDRNELPKENEINNREWTVYSTYYQDSAEKIVGYLSHTANGVVINLNQDIEEDLVRGTMRFTENHAGKQISTELEKTTFVERYLNHIPPPHTVTVRYYGLYSNQFSSKLEELQKEFPIEINYEDQELVDHCPECHTPMDIIKTLEPYEVVMSYEEFCNHDPPENLKKLTVIGPALF
jgi:Putative transposase.